MEVHVRGGEHCDASACVHATLDTQDERRLVGGNAIRRGSVLTISMTYPMQSRHAREGRREGHERLHRARHLLR